MRQSGLAARILRENPASLATDKIIDADDDIIPQCGLERRIIDFLNKIRKFSRFRA